MVVHYLPSNYFSTPILIFVCGGTSLFVGDRRPSSVHSASRASAPASPALHFDHPRLDAWLQGHSYRQIAEGLFGKEQVMGRSWRAHDLRSRIIRLVQNGLAMMRGGYRALLRPPLRKK